MDLLSLVVPLPRLVLGLDGKLDFPENVLKPVERRRRRILQLVLQITHPGGEPVLDESIKYANMPTLVERKAALIHPFESKIEDELAGPEENRVILDRQKLKRCSNSLWDFDRIVYYLCQEKSSRQPEADFELLDVNALEVRADRELEKLQAMDDAGSLVPLYYALRALFVAYPGAPKSEELDNRVRDLLDELEKYSIDSGRNLGQPPGLANRLGSLLES